jgi:phosphoglycerate dehydrogenase-like enzyme
MERVKVLILPQVADRVIDRIAESNPRIDIIDARGWFDGELRSTWPQWTVDRYLGDRKYPSTTIEERNRALSDAEIILLGWPPVKNLRARAPRLKWVHQTPAGASNLFDTDLWCSDVLVTTSRGLTNKRPMAEYVLGVFLHFSRGFHLSYRDRQQHRFDHRTYEPIVLRDKTVCIVGAGGIGQEVAKLCAAAGLRVVGTRRSAVQEQNLPAGFARLESRDGLNELLGEADFVAITCPWTKETTHLIGREAFSALRTGAVLVNISRGEIIDEDALLAALGEGKLRGVALDVYEGEFERPPDRRLWDHERVLITPHVSAVSDISEHQGIDLFCENLTRYLARRPLENVVDWHRGY